MRREASANPKKAVVLAVLVGVALYAWAPLIRAWTGSSDEGPVERPAAAAEGPAGGTEPESPDARRPALPSWEELVRWIEQDPRMVPAEGLGLRRDPFLRLAEQFEPAGPEGVAASEPEQDRTTPIRRLTPQELGMRLSSTIVGPRRRAALISGQAYREGDIIAGTKEGWPYEFTLVEVRPKEVLLQGDSGQFRLSLPEVTGRGRIERSGPR